MLEPSNAHSRVLSVLFVVISVVLREEAIRCGRAWCLLVQLTLVWSAPRPEQIQFGKYQHRSNLESYATSIYDVGPMLQDQRSVRRR